MSERTSAAAEYPYAHESCHKYVFGNDSSSNNYKYIKKRLFSFNLNIPLSLFLNLRDP